MSPSPPPGGRTRVSDAVLDKIVLTVAREVQGVVDVVGLARGAMVGGVIGGTVGLASGGAGGAALGAAGGGAMGAAAAHLMQQHMAYYTTGEHPDIRLHLSARYGTDLVRAADAVRAHIRRSARAIAGIELGTIEVVFTRIISMPKPPPTD